MNWKINPPSTPPNVRGKDHVAAVERMTQWWFENFEHPAGSCPYEDGEWIFVWGGPFDARSELEFTFGDVAAQRTIDAVVTKLETKASQWAPNCNRIQIAVPQNP
jgi:hypothetical protein